MWKRFDDFMQQWWENNRPYSTIILSSIGTMIGVGPVIIFIQYIAR